jgi:undecaprenyl-diphosphatase
MMHRMDQQLLFLINREWTSPALDFVMALASSFALWKIPILVLVALVVWRGGFRARAMMVTLGIAVGFCDGAVSQSLKKIVGRPRPHESLADVRRVEMRGGMNVFKAFGRKPRTALSRPFADVETGNSFPSSHTANTFCAATVLWAFYRRRGWMAYGVSALVGWSRIYTGSHWPSDVALSIFLGIGVALLVLAACAAMWRRWGARFAPRVFEAHPVLFGGAAP